MLHPQAQSIRLFPNSSIGFPTQCPFCICVAVLVSIPFHRIPQMEPTVSCTMVSLQTIPVRPRHEPDRTILHKLSATPALTRGVSTLALAEPLSRVDYSPIRQSLPPHFPQGLFSTVTTSATTSASLDKGDTTNYKYPYDAFAYFLSANFKGLVLDSANYKITPLYPRQKDGYILISPGPDRTYGTNDDICSFGDVNP